MTLHRSTCAAVLSARVALMALLVFVAVPHAHAGIITFQLSEASGSVGGDAILINVSFNDSVVPGSIQATITVVDNPAVAGTGIGDLRALYFNTVPDAQSFLNGLVITGPHVTQVLAQTNNVDNLGGGTVINPLGPFDVGVEIGTAGIGMDDIQTTTLLISHTSAFLTNSLFPPLANDPGFLAVRATSVGTVGGDRNSSGKYGGEGFIKQLNGEEIIPEPSSAVLWGVGGLLLTGFGYLRRRYNFCSRHAA